VFSVFCFRWWICTISTSCHRPPTHHSLQWRHL